MSQTIREIMTQNPGTCRETDTLYDAARLMREHDCGAIPVVNAMNQCIGVVTDRDICLMVVVDGLKPRETPLREVIPGEIYTCTPEDTIDEVIGLMERHKIRRVPVVDVEDRCIGMVSQADIARNTEQSKTGELVGAVSR